MTEKRGLGSGAGSATSGQERKGLAQTRRVDFAAAFVLGERHSVSAAPGNGAPHTSHHLETDVWLLEAHLCGARGPAMLNQCGSLCLQSGQKAASRAALLKVVVVVDLNISSDLLGGINLCECKLDFRWNLWELMETEFSRR